MLHWIVLATSWNILSGYTGYFSFGQGAFFGAGLYTTSTLLARYDWPFLWTLPVAAAVAAALGVGLGAVVFRVRSVRGELFALLTLAITFVLGTIVGNTPIDGGQGVSLASVPVPRIGPTPSSTFYLLALAAATLTLLVAWAIFVSRFGAGLFAIHDDEDAAEVMGVPTYRYKLAALAISCALAGVAGGIHALFLSYVTVGEVFTITVPLTVVLMSVLGGTRHWAGPAIGAVAITGLLYSFTAADHAVAGKAAIGAILIAAVLFMPDGLLPRLQRAFRRRVPARASHRHRPRRRSRRAGSDVEARAGEVVLRVTGLHKQFKGVHALAGVALEARHGEILGLLGPNGSGKSTFINVVSGHYAPSAGEIVFEGHALERRAAHRIAAAGISRTYQIPRPFVHMSVLDNVALAAMFGGAIAKSERGARGGAPVARVHRPRRQGRRSARRPQPAPTEVPRARARARIAAAPGPARRGAVRADAGRDRRRGRTDPQDPRPGIDDHLRRARDARGDGAHRPRRRLPPRRVARGRPCRRRDAAPRGHDRVSRPRPCLKSTSSRSGTARRRRSGASRSCCTPASCSRSSAQTAPARRHSSTRSPGSQPARAGRIVFAGRRHYALAAASLLCRRHRRRARKGAGSSPSMTVRENLELGSYLPAAKAERGASLAAALELFPALREKLASPAGELSGGQQQMVAIARALMARPRLLLLDEPSLGLAPLIVQDVFDAVRRINAQGVAVLLVEQNVAMAMALSDRAYVLEEGRIVAEGEPDDLLGAPRDPACLPRRLRRRLSSADQRRPEPCCFPPPSSAAFPSPSG